MRNVTGIPCRFDTAVVCKRSFCDGFGLVPPCQHYKGGERMDEKETVKECQYCDFYDKTSEKTFMGRPGGCVEVKEQTRSICKKIKHRVKNTSIRECFVPRKEKVVEPEKVVSEPEPEKKPEPERKRPGRKPKNKKPEVQVQEKDDYVKEALSLKEEVKKGTMIPQSERQTGKNTVEVTDYSGVTKKLIKKEGLVVVQ